MLLIVIWKHLVPFSSLLLISWNFQFCIILIASEFHQKNSILKVDDVCLKNVEVILHDHNHFVKNGNHFFFGINKKVFVAP